MRVSYKETAQIADSMAELLGSGVHPERMFDVIQRYRSKRARRALETVREAVGEGLPFHEGFRRSAWAWPPYFVEMTRCAEMAGQLQVGLREGAEHFREMAQVRRALFKLWFNPVAILVGGWIVLTILLWLKKGPTPALMFLAGWLSASVPIACVVVGFLYLPPLRRMLDAAAIHIPNIGEMVRDLACYQFTTCFNYLYIGAVSAPEIVRSAARAVGNSYISRRLAKTAEEVEKGLPFGDSLEPAAYWPANYIASLREAEGAGQLQAVLSRLARERKEALADRVYVTRHFIEPWILYGTAMSITLTIFTYWPFLSPWKTVPL